MTAKLSLITFFLLQFYINAYGQEYSYAQYNVKDGLAGSVVYCGAEDKEGFLWFGTETGLSRFDGTHFKNFTTADGLPDNEILRLFVDSKNRVWIIPYKNSICYYWKGKIYNQTNDSILAKIDFKQSVLNVTEDKQGNILILTVVSVNIITDRQEVLLINNPKQGKNGNVNAGINYEGKFVVSWNYGYVGLYTTTIDGANNFSSTQNMFYGIRGNTQNIQTTPFATMIGVGDSLQFKIAGTGRLASVKLPDNFRSCSILTDSICAVNSTKGTTLFNYREKKIILSCLVEMEINNVLLDSEGCYWFLTAGKGVMRIGSFEFKSFSFDPHHIGNVMPVFCLKKIDSQVYAGSSKSTYFIIDPKEMAATRKQLPLGAMQTRIVCMQQVPAHCIVFGTDRGAVIVGKDSVKRTSELISVKGIDLYKDSLVIVSHLSTRLISMNMNVDSVEHHGRSTAVLVYEGKVYFGKLNGLYILKPNYDAEFLGDRFPPLKNRISALCSTSDGRLWIATYGQGVVGYKNGRITHVITTKEGLKSNICRSLFAYGTDLWVGTDKGLHRLHFTEDNYQIVAFSRDDGLVSDEINAVLVDGTRVYAGTSAGLTCFDADKISQHSYCKLRITNFLAGDIQKNSDSAGGSVSHDQNEIRVDYVGISYRSAGNITYRYRLVGLNDNWQTTRETFLSYPTLPSGDYQLEIIATNKFGVESDMVRIPFTIEKLLWEKIWFRLLMLIGIGMLIWLIVQNRIRKVKKQDEEKMQISNRITELEQMALKAQMNPHFIFNSLNSLQQYVIDKDVLGANKFITEFSRLIRLTLEVSTKANITLYEEVCYLTTYLELEKTKFEDKFTYEVRTAPDVNLADLYLPPMILQPYVENSIRHGVRSRKDKWGHIKVAFSLADNYLVCVVEDNGVGRKAAAAYKSQMPIEYQSRGMTLTAKRIEMLNRGLTFPVLISIEDLYKEETGAGTRITIRFPQMQG